MPRAAPAVALHGQFVSEPKIKMDTIYGYATMNPQRHSVMTHDIQTTRRARRDYAVEFSFILVFAAIAGLAILVAYRASQAPTFELRKDDWLCTKSHDETTTVYQNMGDGKTIMLIPITTTTRVCDQWSKR